MPYEIVGTAKALGSVFGQSQDNFIMIPIQSYFKTYDAAAKGLELVAKAIDQEHLGEARTKCECCCGPIAISSRSRTTRLAFSPPIRF